MAGEIKIAALAVDVAADGGNPNVQTAAVGLDVLIGPGNVAEFQVEATDKNGCVGSQIFRMMVVRPTVDYTARRGGGLAHVRAGAVGVDVLIGVGNVKTFVVTAVDNRGCVKSREFGILMR